jgi:sulfatase modifying factor 1
MCLQNFHDRRGLMAEITSQDLTHEALLQSIGRMQVGAFRQPALGGIPLLSKIGQGESGACYRATHPTLECEVAVKVTPCKPDTRSERFGLFMANAKNAINVESPRLVKVYEVGTEADVFFQVMEYVNGRSAQHQLTILRERLKPGMDEVSVLDLCIAACQGLAAAHDAGFIHRDIRPSSILIPQGEGDTPLYAEAKLADLGLAYNDAAARALDGSPAETGTPGFMSPEEAVGSKDISASSDVFSMGATMYSLLVGQPPFGGPSLSVLLSSTVIHESNDLRTWRPDVSRALARVVEGCLKKNASARFHDGSVLLKALKIACGVHKGTMESQAEAIKEIDALLPSVAKLDPAIKQFLSNAEPMALEPVEVPDASDEKTMIKPMSFAAITTSQGGDALAEAKRDFEATPVSEVPEAVEISTGGEIWEDPTPAHDIEVPQQRRSRTVPMMAAALLLLAVGAGAWQLGFLGGKKKPPVRVVMNSATDPDPLAKEKAEKEAKEKADADKLAAEAEAKAKEDADKVAAEKTKSAKDAEERAIADAKTKAAAAAKAKEDAEAKAKDDADAKLKAEADAKQKVIQDEVDRQAAEAAKLKEENEARAAAAAKVKAEELERKRIAEAEARAREEQEVNAKALAEKEAAEKKKLALESKKTDAEKIAAAAASAAAAKAKEDEAARVAAKAKADQDAIDAKRLADNSKTAPTPVPTTPTPLAVTNDLPQEVAADLGNGVSMDFVLVSGGTFMMGTDRDALHELCRKAQADEKDYADEVPAHRVDVAPYYIAKTPVTVAQFRAFVSATQYRTAAERRGEAYTLVDHAWQLTPGTSWMKPGFPQGEDHPVVNLNWRDCNAFSEWASKQCGKSLRLPSESEWEYAARGPQNNIYPWGNTWDGRRANHSDQRLHPIGPRGWTYSTSDDGFAFTAPVGSFNNRSWCGALDMAGNVFQWCQDAHAEYPQSPNAPEILVDPGDVPANAKRALRGGSYLFRPIDCRSAARRSLSPNAWSYELGMRLAFTPAK